MKYLVALFIFAPSSSFATEAFSCPQLLKANSETSSHHVRAAREAVVQFVRARADLEEAEILGTMSQPALIALKQELMAQEQKLRAVLGDEPFQSAVESVEQNEARLYNDNAKSGNQIEKHQRQDELLKFGDWRLVDEKFLDIQGRVSHYRLHNYRAFEDVVFNRDGSMFAGRQMNTLYVFDAFTGQQIGKQELTGDWHSFHGFSQDNKSIITESYGKIRIYDIKTGYKQFEFDKTKSSFRDIDSSGTKTIEGPLKSGGAIFVYRKNNSRIRWMEWLAPWRKMFKLEASETINYNKVRFSPNGQYIVGLGVDKSNKASSELSIWSAEDGRLIHNFKYPPELHFADGYIRDYFQFSPDGNKFLTITEDMKMAVLGSITDGTTQALELSNDVTTLALHPGGKYFATNKWKKIRIWEAHSGVLAEEIDLSGVIPAEYKHFTDHLHLVPSAGIEAIRFSPDGAEIVVITGYGSIQRWRRAELN